MPPETLNSLLQRAAEYPQTGLRLLDRREQETWLGWDEVYRQAESTATRLLALGIEHGDRVALIYPTGADFFSAFFGILRAGAVPVPLYPPVRLGRLDEYHRRTARMLTAVSARLVLADGRVERLLGETMAAARPEFGCKTLARLPPPADSELPSMAESADTDSLALVQFSSGTTVDPKPVALSHRAILAQVRALNSFWPPEAGVPTGVSWLPLYHDMGLIGCIFPALELPSVMTLIGPEVFVAKPAIWLRALSKYRAEITVAPNFAYGLCTEKIRDEDLEGVDLSAWRVALNGAESIAPSVLRDFQQRFAAWGFRPEALTPVYGLSEASLAVTFSDLEEPFSARSFDREQLATDGLAVPAAEGIELVSVGKPLPEVAVRVVDADGGELDAGLEGRVWVRSPALMDGYLDRPEATAEALQGGWLDTGDLGFLHQGELFLTGRAKDVLILRGRNYSPLDVEQAVDGLEGVRRGCVVAVSWLPEGAPAESLEVFVESAQKASANSRQSLPRRAAEAVLAATGLRLDAIRVLEPGTLPRTSSGKLRRRQTLELHRRGELLPPRRVTPFYLAGAMARSKLASVRSRRGQTDD